MLLFDAFKPLSRLTSISFRVQFCSTQPQKSGSVLSRLFPHAYAISSRLFRPTSCNLILSPLALPHLAALWFSFFRFAQSCLGKLFFFTTCAYPDKAYSL